jgi:tetratricopeptide (TPR) repeat protein/TolB-like protein
MKAEIPRLANMTQDGTIPVTGNTAVGSHTGYGIWIAKYFQNFISLLFWRQPLTHSLRLFRDWPDAWKAIFLATCTAWIVFHLKSISSHGALLQWLMQWRDILWTALQIAGLVLAFTWVCLMLKWLSSEQEGICVSPLENTTGDTQFNGRALSDALVAALQRIRSIHEIEKIEIATPIVLRRVEFMPVRAGTEHLSAIISNIGTVGVGDSKFSVGSLLLVLKAIWPCSASTKSALAGSIRRQGKHLVLAVRLEHHGQVYAWEVHYPYDDSDAIQHLVEDMAYKIVRHICWRCDSRAVRDECQSITEAVSRSQFDSNSSGVNWESFKYFTEAVHWCHRYMQTQNPSDLDKACQNCEKAKESQQNYIRLHDLFYNIGVAYYNHKRYDVARRMFNHALSVQQRSTQALNGLGNVSLVNGDYEQAIRFYSRALLYDAKDPYPHNALANIYCQQGKYELAMQHCQQAIHLDKRYAWPHNNKAFVEWHQGEYGEALHSCHKAVEVAANNGVNFSWPYNTEGYIHLLCNDLESAKEAFLKAIGMDAKFDWPVHNLGIIALMEWKYEDALRYFQDALELCQAPYATFHFNLGLCYALMGRASEAAQVWRENIEHRGASVLDGIRQSIFAVALHAISPSDIEQAKVDFHMKNLNEALLSARNVRGEKAGGVFREAEILVSLLKRLNHCESRFLHLEQMIRNAACKGKTT